MCPGAVRGTYVTAEVEVVYLPTRLEIDDWERPTSLAISAWLNPPMR